MHLYECDTFAVHRVTYLTNKFRDGTIESAEVYLRQMTNFCPVSGSPLTNGGMQLQYFKFDIVQQETCTDSSSC